MLCKPFFAYEPCHQKRRAQQVRRLLYPLTMGAFCLVLATILYIWDRFGLFLPPPEPFSFPHGKRMAYVSSWDDTGNIHSMHLIARLQLLEGITFPLTINAQTIALSNATVAEYRRLLCRGVGDRVESHTWSHIEGGHDPINDPREYVLSQRAIQRAFGCEHGTTLTYPRGHVPESRGTKNLISHLYAAGRSTQHGLFRADADIFALPCIAVEDITPVDIERAMAAGAVLISYGHGVEGSGWRPIPQARLLQHMRHLKDYSSDIWFTTLPEVVAHLRSTGQLAPRREELWRCRERAPASGCTA